MNSAIEDRIRIALERQEPKEPIRRELGGGYYYKCPWLVCGETINKFMEYCPKCGQRIDWKETE